VSGVTSLSLTHSLTHCGHRSLVTHSLTHSLTRCLRRSSFVLRPSSFAVRRSSFVVRRPPFVVRRSSFVIRPSPFVLCPLFFVDRSSSSFVLRPSSSLLWSLLWSLFWPSSLSSSSSSLSRLCRRRRRYCGTVVVVLLWLVGASYCVASDFGAFYVHSSRCCLRCCFRSCALLLRFLRCFVATSFLRFLRSGDSARAWCTSCSSSLVGWWGLPRTRRTHKTL